MGRVFKKGGAKRGAQPEKKEETVVTKKAKKEEEEPELPIEDDEEDDDDVSDEEVADEEEDEDVEDEEGDDDEDVVDEEDLEFEFTAFPPAEGDEDGIVNILTQTFLRTDVDLKGAAKSIIENAPHGLVIVQEEGNLEEEEKEEKEGEEEKDEEDGMIYGVCTSVGLNDTPKDDAPKFIKDIFAYLLSRAKKGAPSEIYKRLEEIQAAGDGKTAMFINDRLLNFSTIIVPQLFSHIRDELNSADYKKYKTFIYIQKIRIAESDESSSGAGKKGGEAPKKKGKMGKAEKKRAAAAALAGADVEFDNVEDKFLFQLTTGKEVHFDYPVHMDVEPGSKFHVVEKDGKKWNPFRRVVIMDSERLNEFLERGNEAVVE